MSLDSDAVIAEHDLLIVHLHKLGMTELTLPLLSVDKKHINRYFAANHKDKK